MRHHWSDEFADDICGEAIDWLRLQGDPSEAWQLCRRGDWMAWWLEHCGIASVYDWRNVVRDARHTASAACPTGSQTWFRARLEHMALVADHIREQFPDLPVKGDESMSKKTIAPIRPEVHNVMTTVGEKLGELCPPGIGFCLLMFDFGPGGFTNYISSARREDMIECLREFLEVLEGEGEN